MAISDRTVLYYTSNNEDPVFEAKIIADLKTKVGDLPIISVSQKLLDLGRNICVGEVGLSYVNMAHQLLLGCRAAETPYIVMAESDFLYPEDYFQSEPPRGDCSRYDNIWVVYGHSFRMARQKNWSEGAMMVRRDWYIDFLKAFIRRHPTWTTEHFRLPSAAPFETWHGDVPCVTFKSGRGVRRYAGTVPDVHEWQIPYWGHVDDLRMAYLGAYGECTSQPS